MINTLYALTSWIYGSAETPTTNTSSTEKTWTFITDLKAALPSTRSIAIASIGAFAALPFFFNNKNYTPLVSTACLALIVVSYPGKKAKPTPANRAQPIPTRLPTPPSIVRAPTPPSIVRAPTPPSIVRAPTPPPIVRAPTPVETLTNQLSEVKRKLTDQKANIKKAKPQIEVVLGPLRRELARLEAEQKQLTRQLTQAIERQKHQSRR